MTTLDIARPKAPAVGAWRLVAGRDLRDLWGRGRGILVVLVAAVLFSAVTYLSASEASLNLLDAKEAVHLLIQVVVIIGCLLVLVSAADAISGERERRTLEPVLLAPVSRRDLAIGKLVAAVSLWFATLVVAIPYILVLADGPAIVFDALTTTAIIGTLVAVGLAGLALLISAFSGSNRLSLASALFVVLVLTAPSRVPGITKNSVGEALLHINPITSGLGGIERIIVKGDSWSEAADWLVSPAIAAVLTIVIAVALAPRLFALERS